MHLKVHQLARLMDLSAVRADVDLDEVHELADVCKQYNCVCAFVMPCYTPLLVELLSDAPNVGVGGVVGFPSGAVSTEIKVAEARQQIAQGVNELDMVINVGLLRSGRLAEAEADIRAVVEAAEGMPVKVILEAHYLTDQQIILGSEISVRAGAAFVKTGTGWAPTGATFSNVELIVQTVGESAHVKAAGGVRDLDTVVAMIRRGVTRFGVGLSSAQQILDACAALPDGVEL